MGQLIMHDAEQVRKDWRWVQESVRRGRMRKIRKARRGVGPDRSAEGY